MAGPDLGKSASRSREGAVKPLQAPAAAEAVAPSRAAFVRVQPKRVFEEVILQIRRELALGNLKPGDKLPSERDLVEQFGVSRLAVREALRTLENAGIVTSVKGVKGGAFVRKADPELLTRLLGDLISLGSISLESLTEARVHFLSMVVQLAAQSAKDADIKAMTSTVDEVERFTMNWSDQRRQEAIGGFYEHLALATGNEVLVMLVRSITDIVRAVLLEVAPPPRVDTVATFREVIAALRNRDAMRASDLMRSHLEDLHEYLLAARIDAGLVRSNRGAMKATS